ncbi:MAG: sodium:solute symporter, partial [Solirubrobacterales bacterium]|nr:sodium:solute symporter [Solirubrobacterales bacterium]
MMPPLDVVALTVFIIIFAAVTVLGFLASRWRRGDLDLLHEWGLAGRRFGTVVTWFLLGGDLYTAYTFIAVPAAVFGTGAIGFFAVPYTIIVYPFVFVVMPRLWSVARRHHYITGADFVRGRYSSRSLALAVAFTGILATMPYIALQLVGIEVVMAAMGIPGDAPLVIAFVILAAYTYFSGLRAPAMIALVKDVIIYITVFAAIIIIPIKLGGFGNIFTSANAALQAKGVAQGVLLAPGQFVAY